MVKLVIGSETDRAAAKRLKRALKNAGAKRLRRGWALFGSQEINNSIYVIDGDQITVEAETYVGISIEGNDRAINAVKRYLSEN